METADAKTRRAPLQLLPKQDISSGDSVISIGWCMSPEIIKHLEAKGARDPHILFVITHDGQEMSRELVSITSPWHYLRFMRAGKNVVHATLVWSDRYGRQTVKETLLEIGRRRYPILREKKPETELLQKQYYSLQAAIREREENSPREADSPELQQMREAANQAFDRYLTTSDQEIPETFLDLSGLVERIDFEAQLDVHVSEKLFGRSTKTTTWLGNIVQWDTPARDNCDMRRRALIGGLLLLPLSLWWLIKHILGTTILEVANLLSAGLLVALGLRDVDFSPLRHPLTQFTADMWKGNKPSRWWTKKITTSSTTTYKRRSHLGKIAYAVLAAFTASGIIYRSQSQADGNVSLWLAWGLVVLLAVGTVGALGIIRKRLSGPKASYAHRPTAATSLSERFDAIVERKMQDQKSARQQKDLKRQQQLAQDLEQLACDVSPRPFSLVSIPRKRETMVLQYNGLKAKVCKPFPKR